MTRAVKHDGGMAKDDEGVKNDVGVAKDDAGK